MEIKVKEADGLWGLYINGELLATSKHRFDADHAAAILRRASSAHESADMREVAKRLGRKT